MVEPTRASKVPRGFPYKAVALKQEMSGSRCHSQMVPPTLGSAVGWSIASAAPTATAARINHVARPLRLYCATVLRSSLSFLCTMWAKNMTLSVFYLRNRFVFLRISFSKNLHLRNLSTNNAPPRDTSANKCTAIPTLARLGRSGARKRRHSTHLHARKAQGSAQRRSGTPTDAKGSDDEATWSSERKARKIRAQKS